MPKLGEPLFYWVGPGSNDYTVVEWSGNHPAGARPVTKEEFLAKAAPNIIEENQAQLQDGYIAPWAKNFQQGAPIPTEQYFTPEYLAQQQAQPGYMTPEAFRAANAPSLGSNTGGNPTEEELARALFGTAQQSAMTAGFSGQNNEVSLINEPSNNEVINNETINNEVISATGNPVLDETLKSIQTYLDKLTEKGQTINPYVDITPEKMAEFLKQAESEIDPYYQTQLKLARESILTDLDYSKEQIGKFEQDLEKTYGKSLRSLGESAAEQGFAMSGQRQLNEQDLAYQTQRQIEDKRNQFAYGAGQAARTFAQEWGKPDFTPTISTMPTVRAGERSFATSGTQAPVYELSNDIYDQLVGSKQYEQTAAKLTRQAQLESAFKESELSKRYLSLV